jgi:hypothetical protein
VTAADQRWVLAVDVRPAGSAPRTATADDEGVRAHAVAASSFSVGLPEVVRAEAAGRARIAPLAVVVVHPATWDDVRAARAADDVGAAISSTVGEDAAEWPWPVPLNAVEASAWRALEFGLLPARGRVAVVDPATGEAGVIDREYGRLAGAGTPQGVPSPAGDEQLVALARRVLDAAPAGPPFVGLVVGGAGGSDSAGLASVVARVTGRPPLVPGDPATVALLGAASLGWAAATAPADGPPVPRRRPWTTGQEGGPGAGGAGSGGADAVPAGRGRSGAVGPAAPDRTALPGTRRRRRRLPRWARWLLPLAALAVVAVAAGLLVHRQRTTPSPFTYTCPNGQVVAFRYECDRLAPSPSSAPGTP